MWFYVENDQQKGPVSEVEFSDLVEKGIILRSTLVWRDGQGEWQPAAQVLPHMPYDVAAGEPPPAVGYRPPPGGSPTFGGGGGGDPVPDYLVFSILATVLCCLPAGIISIVYSVKANNARQYGDYANGLQAASTAKTWLIVSVATILIPILLYVLFAILVGIGGALGN